MRKLNLFTRGLVSLFLLTLLSGSLLAQASSSLRGTIIDPKGAVVAGAKVTLLDSQNGFTRSAVTDERGDYQFLQVPPSTYQVTVSAPGFATLKQEALQLLVNTPTTQNFTMKVATESVTVDVSSTAPLVNTQDATLGHAFDTDKIAALPFEGRDPVAILSLQPGVSWTGNSTSINADVDSRQGSVNGARSDQTNVTLDGVDNNDQGKGYALQGALRSTLDSLQEFRVTTSNSNADSGRSSGAQVALVTKSGTNSLHGTVYEYHRPTFTTANDWFNKQAQLNSGLPNRAGKLIRNTFGATVGGPIVKDRLFFFGAYEGQRQRENQQVTRTVPSENLRQGIISYLCDPSDPNCANPQPGFNVADGPLGRVVTLTPQQFAQIDPNCSSIGSCPLGPGANPAVLSVFNQYPLPNNDSVGDGLDFRGYTFSAPSPNKLDTYILKLDYNITANGNHRMFVRGGLNNDHLTLQPEQFPGQQAALVGVNNSKGIVAGYSAVLSNNLINNFRFGYIRQGIGQAGLQSKDFVHFRNLDDVQAFTSTMSTILPVKNFVDDVTWTKGRHTLQFGANYRLVDNIADSNSVSFTGASTNVSFLNTSGIAGAGTSLDPGAFSAQGFPGILPSFGSAYDSPASALAGLVTDVTANYNFSKTGATLPDGQSVARHYRNNELEFYAQDTFRLKPNFTVTLGLRYSLLQAPYETTGTQVAPTTSLHDFFNKRGQAGAAGQSYAPLISFDLAGKANGKKGYWDTDYGDIAPRIAFAWSPNQTSGFLGKLFGSNGKSSIRGGYGIYYDHFGQGVVNAFNTNGSFGLSTSISNPAGVQTADGAARFSGLYDIPTTSFSGCDTPPCTLKPPSPGGAFPSTPPASLDAGGFAITWGLDDKLKTPYSHVVDFSWTRDLGHGFVFEATYVGRFAHRLLQEEDLAQPLNLTDPKSKTTYYQAATQFAKLANSNTQVADVQPIAYWEDLFHNAAGPASSQLNGCGGGFEGNVPTNLTATQAMYDLFACFLGNETTALFVTDLFCFPGCADTGSGPNIYQYYQPQYSSLFGWRSIGNSSYNSGQFSLRRAFAQGFSFDLNYTYSKSIDLGSNAERINEFQGFGFNSQIINSWQPNQNRAVSDFDLTHQINFNWVADLPFGHGRKFAGDSNRFLNGIIGGWQLSGLYRWSSGFPFTIDPGLGFWPTNWQLTSHGVLVGPKPKTGQFRDQNGDPNVFGRTTADINNAIGAFRFAYPGETGSRNVLRGPGAFGFDAGLAKSWKITERQSLKFAWQVYNVTNSVRFDAANGNHSLSNGTSFGKYVNTLTKPRDMEFSLRYSF